MTCKSTLSAISLQNFPLSYEGLFPKQDTDETHLFSNLFIHLLSNLTCLSFNRTQTSYWSNSYLNQLTVDLRNICYWHLCCYSFAITDTKKASCRIKLGSWLWKCAIHFTGVMLPGELCWIKPNIWKQENLQHCTVN